MDLGRPTYPFPANEPVLSYAPGSPERSRLKAVLGELKGQTADVPMTIGGKEVRTGDTVAIRPPQEIAHTHGHYHKGNRSQVEQAIQAALAARESMACTPFESRASIFLKVADLITGKYRALIIATT